MSTEFRVISEADLANAQHELDQQINVLRATVLGIKAERDELLEALRALWNAATIDDPPTHLIKALFAARLAILRAEKRS